MLPERKSFTLVGHMQLYALMAFPNWQGTGRRANCWRIEKKSELN